MAAIRVQSISNTSLLTSVVGTLSTNPLQGNLLIAAVTSDVGVTSISMSGWTGAGSIALGLAGGLDVFYKIASGTESGTITATATLATFIDMHIYEYSGLDNSTPLLSVATVADSGLGVTSRSGGTTSIAASGPILTFSAVAQSLINGDGASWTNGMNVGITTTHLISADLPISTCVAQDTTASWSTSQRAAGLIATFIAQRGNSYYQGGR